VEDDAGVEAPSRLPPGEVARAGMVLIGLVVGVALLWQLREVLLLLFVAVLVATAIEPIVNRLRRGPFSHGSGTLVVYGTIVLLLGGGAYLAAPGIAAQTAALTESLPERLQAMRPQLEQLPSALRQPAATLLDRASQVLGRPAAPTEPEQVVEIGALAARVVLDFVTVFVVAFYWLVERNAIKRIVLKTVGPRRARGVNTVWLEVEE
jgi:predicted PurR-regulated permease PerM